MKPVTTKRNDKSILLQLRLVGKGKQELSPYEAYEILALALKDHPKLVIQQAEFRISKDEEKTSIE
jgi:hypothetical protein